MLFDALAMTNEGLHAKVELVLEWRGTTLEAAMRRGAAILGTALVLGGPAWAADRTEVVTFPAGKTAVSLRGTIRGDDGVVYRIDAGAGQTLQILFAPTNRACVINVYAPGKEIGRDEAAFIGSTSGNEFGVHPTAAGSYKAQLSLMRSAARRGQTCRYTLAVELTGPPGGASAGVSDQLMADACKAAAAPMYAVQPRKVTLSGKSIATSDGGFAIDGVVDKGGEGIKKLRCLYTPDRRFSHIQAMTSDGE